MKVLVVTDLEDKLLYDCFRKERVEGVELIVSCGDLRADYLDFLMTMVNRPMIYVRGNHDDELNAKPPLGGICIENKVYRFGGVRFFGLGGCKGAQQGALNRYSENSMRMRILKSEPSIALSRGIDVFVAHSPVRGYGDVEGSHTHEGFDCFNDFLGRHKPAIMLHGHVHNNYGRVRTEFDHPSGTKIINCCPFKIIDIPGK